MKVCFCLHNHQPVGNFDHVIEAAYRDCYLPMLDALKEHPEIRSGIHISGTLLEWITQNHPEYIERIAELCHEGRMELLTSGRYEPILTIFRRFDIIQQIKEYSEYLTQFSRRKPSGLWLTERVWEPQLSSILSEAGVSWAVVDDVHLLRAGVTGMDIFRPCITEDSGKTVKLLGSNREMRYRIPFSPVESVMERLKEMHNSGANLVFYGDDGEKFGVWPGTHRLCYIDNWLDRFFTEVESADWLDSLLPSEAAETEASGPFYIPASSYPEMAEWTLNCHQRDEFDNLKQLFESNGKSDIAEVFLSGGFWRNFLSLYPESKELHGRILSAESLVRESGNSKALDHLWRSQCNCAFWHGVFGGIYLPHLREALWKELSRAESIALDSVNGYPLVKKEDVNADGLDEVVIISRTGSLLIYPDRGLTVSELTFMHPDGEPVPFGHVLSRQSEQYHNVIPDTDSSEDVKTIHDKMASKEEGLAAKLIIDRWRRMCFSDLVMPSDATFTSWRECDAATADFQCRALSSSFTSDISSASLSGEFRKEDMSVFKSMSVRLNESILTVNSIYSIQPGDRAGMEICLNLMTGRSPDRYFRVDAGDKYQMSTEGEFRGKTIEVTDCWRRVRTHISMNSEMNVWVTPLDSVNRSECGYESVHQGSAFYIWGIADAEGSLSLEISMIMEALDDT